jgi:hydroxyacylglutathione hydrolase
MLTVECFSFNPFSENTYLIYNDHKECVIVDPGCYDHREQAVLKKYIDDQGLSPKYIFLTHTHIDHVMGLHFVKSTYQIPIIAHPLAAKGIGTTELVAKLYGLSIDLPPPIDEFKTEADLLQLGTSAFQLLFCPGHAPDHLVLYAPQDGFAIVGDVIFNGSIGRTDLPGGDYETLMKSIHEQLLILPSETVLYPGHGPETTIKQEITNNPFLK